MKKKTQQLYACEKCGTKTQRHPAVAGACQKCGCLEYYITEDKAVIHVIKKPKGMATPPNMRKVRSQDGQMELFPRNEDSD